MDRYSESVLCVTHESRRPAVVDAVAEVLEAVEDCTALVAE